MVGSKQGCRAIDFDTIFVAVNYEENQNNTTDEDAANDDLAMMRSVTTRT